MTFKSKIQRLTKKQLVFYLSVAAGLIYNFWVLGYVLDPQALHDTYFSVLESYHRPYSWVFILSDVITSMLVILIVWLISGTVSRHKDILIGLGLFAAGTLIDATMPIADRCSSNIGACGINPMQILSFHDLASLTAYLAFFYCLLSCYRILRNHKSAMRRWLQLIFYGWISSGIFLLISVIANQFTALSQGLFLAFIGFGLIVIPMVIMSRPEPA